MSRLPEPRVSYRLAVCGILLLASMLLVVTLGSSISPGEETSGAGAIQFYSTASPPGHLTGIAPRALAPALTDPEVKPAGSPPPPTPESSEAAKKAAESEQPVARLADATPETHVVPQLAREVAGDRPVAEAAPQPASSEGPEALEDPVARALRMIQSCRQSYRDVQDYTCTFFKRERIGGQMSPYSVMAMKARSQPRSIYFKFMQPTPGREAIWVDGGNDGKIVVHDVGIGKLVAGTLKIDPKGKRALSESRHPVTEAGIGPMIDKITYHWTLELNKGETQIRITPGVKVADRTCTMIQSTHPKRSPSFLFHSIRVYIDQEHNLPIRFESYDWPRGPGVPPDLLEEYTYNKLRVNVGLSQHDFDPDNEQYSFGRF